MLTSGKADVSIVFSTDGQIAADDLLVLEDDQQALPALQRVADRQRHGGREGRAGPAQDRRPGAAGPLDQGDAGAQLPRRPRQGEARRSRRPTCSSSATRSSAGPLDPAGGWRRRSPGAGRRVRARATRRRRCGRRAGGLRPGGAGADRPAPLGGGSGGGGRGLRRSGCRSPRGDLGGRDAKRRAVRGPPPGRDDPADGRARQGGGGRLAEDVRAAGARRSWSPAITSTGARSTASSPVGLPRCNPSAANLVVLCGLARRRRAAGSACR